MVAIRNVNFKVTENGITNDEFNSAKNFVDNLQKIGENSAINSMKIIGTFCEKCRMPYCICRKNEAVLNAINDDYKWIVLDRLIYRVRKDDYCDLNNAVSFCCRMNCRDTLLELKKACDIIKEKYKPYTEWHQNYLTPNLSIKDDVNGDYLPF